MKKLVLAVALLAIVSAASAQTTHDSNVFVSCDAVAVAAGCAWSPDLSAAEKITFSLYAVNPTTGATDLTATSNSTVIFEYKEDTDVPPNQFPKPGANPITNVGGGCPDPSNCAFPGRTFKAIPRMKYVRCNVLTLSAPSRLTCKVTYAVGR